MVHAFFDDGRSFGKEGFLCLTGYASDDSRWDQFSSDWTALLKKHQLTHLHTSDFLAGRGEAERLALALPERIAAVQEFIGAVRASVLFGAAVGIDGAAFDELGRGSKKKPSAESFAFFRLMRMMVERLRAWTDTRALPISLVFDDSEHSARFLSHYHELKRHRSEFRTTFSGIAFSDDRHVMPLQAADLLACVTVREQRKKEPWGHESPFRDLLRSDDPAFGLQYLNEYWDRETIERHRSEIFR